MVRKLTATLFAMLMLTAGAAGGVGAVTPSDASTTDQLTELQQDDNSSVNVTTGQQLSTVLAVTSDDVQSEVEETEFEVEYDNASEEARARALANRAAALEERTNRITDAYETATEAYEDGELTKSEYAQRIATLNSRASNLLASYDALSERSNAFSALELRAAGFNESALDGAVDSLDSVSGTGASALLQQFTGESEGEVEIESANGLTIEVESEDGEQSRELNRPGDESANLTVNQSTALDTARDALPTVEKQWRLVNSRIDSEDGNYEFRFHVNTNTTVGQASATVDGSAGTVVELESTTRQKGPANADEASENNPGRGPPEEAGERGDDEDDTEQEDEERELALVVAEGDIAPNSTITVRALADGEAASNVTVTLNGEPVGTTGADGTVSVTLPESGEVELEAGEGELELELGEDDDEVYRNLTADATLEGDTVTATVQYEGSGVAGASVYANDEQVGTTDANGTVSFAVPNGTESFEVEIVKGEFEAEFEYELTDGTLSMTESPHAGDNGDRGRSDEAPGHSDDDADDEGDEDDRGEGDDNRSERAPERDDDDGERGPPDHANAGDEDEADDEAETEEDDDEDDDDDDKADEDDDEVDDEETDTASQTEQ